MSEKKVKLRMGMHNRITKDRWRAIKDDCDNKMPVAKIARRHSVSESTVRSVRKSKNFYEYRLNNDRRLHGQITVIEPTSGVAYEYLEKSPSFFSSKKVKPKNVALSDNLDQEAENTARLFGIILLGIIVVAGVVVLGLTIAFISSLVRGAR